MVFPGWTVFRIPEHDVRTKAALAETVDRLVPVIHVAFLERAAFDTGEDGV